MSSSSTTTLCSRVGISLSEPRVVVTKKEEFRGAEEKANRDHYRVDGVVDEGLYLPFEDFFLEAPDLDGEVPQTDFCLQEDTLAQEAADLWFGDGDLVNDWVEEEVGIGGFGL